MQNRLLIPFIVALASISPWATASSHNETAYIERYFNQPPQQYQPFVRWWWNGGRVTAHEIRRQLDVMHAAGIGGVEINTIAMPVAVPPESYNVAPELKWMSGEWARMLEVAADYSRELGMTPDVIIGSGWPFGGEFLPPDYRSKKVSSIKVELPRSGAFRTTIEAIAPELHVVAYTDEGLEPARREVLSLLLVEQGRGTGMESVRQLSVEDSVDPATGAIEIEVPRGNFVLYVALLEKDYTHVKLGAPGSAGPVLDHFNTEAVESYLVNMSGRIRMELGRDMDSLVRATFVDSLELEEANWTDGFAEEFAQRRGYQLLPYLPLLLTEQDPSWNEELRHIVRDVRYDYFKTIIEVFNDSFLDTYVRWSEANGLESRMQTYGLETHPLHGSMRPSLPEGESWLWNNLHGEPASILIDSTSINKYVSSAAHLTGQQTISFEAMTNAIPISRETLEEFKRCLDQTLLHGVNHPIIHGFNYTPLEAGFPGWVRFGCYLNERTPFWPYFKLFSDYASRVGLVSRNAEFFANVAILSPRGEEWEQHGLLYQPFPQEVVPWYQYMLPEAFQMQGVGTDFTSEEIIQASSVSDGKLRYNSRSYDMIVLEDVTALNAATAEQLAAFARNGGKLVFIGSVPDRSLGLLNREEDTRRIQRAMRQALDAGAMTFPTPQKPANHRSKTERQYRGGPLDYTSVLALAGDIAEETGILHSVEIAQPRAHLSQVHHIDNQGTHYHLFVNNSLSETVDTHIRFTQMEGDPIIMDPLSGVIGGSLPEDEHGYQLVLRPLESMLLRLKDEATATNHSDHHAAPRLRPLNVVDRMQFGTAWDLEFHTANKGPVFTRRYDRLSDLSQVNNDTAVADFAGRIHYTNTIELDAVPEHVVLNLGQLKGTSHLFVNGHDLGAIWFGLHEYTLDGYLKPGRNDIRIEVTTQLGNYFEAKKDDPMAQRIAGWFPQIRMGIEQDPVLEVRSF